MRGKKGISLIVLIVTIIVMIIIAGAVIISLSDTNIIDQATNATKNWNISTIKEQLNMKNAMLKANLEVGSEYTGEIKNGTLTDLGIEDSEYNNKLIIENGNLVYRPENVTDKEAQEFIASGITAGTHICLVNAETKENKYKSVANIITLDELSNYADKTIYVLEDIVATGYTSISEFTGILDGQNHIISSLSAPLVINNKGTIKKLKLAGEVSGDDMAAFAITNAGNIINCHNGNTSILAMSFGAGIAVYNNESGVILNCSNNSYIDAGVWAAGIVAENYGKVYNCFNSGLIESEDAVGIVQYNYNEVKNCYNKGKIQGDSAIGKTNGLLSINHYASNNSNKDIFHYGYNIGEIIAGTRATCIASDGRNIDNVYAKYEEEKKLVISEEQELTNSGWIDELDLDETSLSLEDKAILLDKLNAGNTTKIWVDDVNNINDGFPILYWQAK